MAYDGIIKIAGTFKLNTSLKSLDKIDFVNQMNELIKQIKKPNTNKGLDPKQMEILLQRLRIPNPQIGSKL